jgi:Tfp pilus assembly protein PilX
MNQQQNPNQKLLQFILRAQQLARQDARSDQGYAMMIVSVISIFMFSMLAAYMTITNLTKSSTNAYVDGTNTFYAAESGLNRRAQQLREKFIGYELPSADGSAISVATPATFISNCFPIATTALATNNDFECRNYPFRYNNNAATSKSSDGHTVLSDVDNNSNSINYVAYTFVSARQDYALTPPTPSVIPAGQVYAGLNALEYQYTVFAAATKPNPVHQGDAKIVLQMDFKSRIVPLFQFAVFYDGDLEMNSSSNMTISGRVHTNANLYVQPYTTSNTISTTFLSPVTAAGSIYNRVDSMNGAELAYAGITNVLTTGTSCGTGTCVPFPAFVSATQTPITPLQLAAYAGNVRDGAAGTQRLDTPPPGFLRKRNYANDKIGEYYAKADLRLEMVPDRDVTNTGATPWTRDTGIIPFNFTSITTGGTGTCSTASPPADPATTGIPTLTSDPAANYIDPDRNNASSLRCHVFTKGQLQSLRQPVLVLTNINQPNAALQTAEGTALGIPTVPSTPAGLSGGLIGNVTRKNKILRALQVALASTPSPVALDKLDKSFSDGDYSTGSLNTFKTEFGRLLGNISGLGGSDTTALLAASPNEIAALRGAWFLPAPIQRIETNNPQDSTRNLRRSGFYDGREQRWITMLQTNVASLSVWNRDGLFVEATTAANGGGTATPDTTLTTPYQTNNDMKDAAFNGGTGANFTDGLAFDRAATIPATAKGLQQFGLGSIDKTEGGLVFHATVSDDLNGDGSMSAANDVSLDIANPVHKTDAVGNFVGMDNKPLPLLAPPIVIDYPRKYRSGNRFQSPFGFAFNGGDYLPAPMTLVTDQAIYTQGNFNNNGAIQPAAARNTPDPNRLPASIIGDTITILSNQCLSASSNNNNNNDLLVPAGQISCGLPRTATGSVDVNGATYYTVTGPTAVNAAFLSNTDRSSGNLGAGRGFTTGAGAAGNRFSGAINNYIRMLENWGGATGQFFNYSGSFVSLGTPLEYSGIYFPGGTYYNIPSRNFNFDPKFNAFTSLPPLPPRAIYLKQDVFKRNYN